MRYCFGASPLIFCHCFRRGGYEMDVYGRPREHVLPLQILIVQMVLKAARLIVRKIWQKHERLKRVSHRGLRGMMPWAFLPSADYQAP
jgi:hypothetical protein